MTLSDLPKYSMTRLYCLVMGMCVKLHDSEMTRVKFADSIPIPLEVKK